MYTKRELCDLLRRVKKAKASILRVSYTIEIEKMCNMSREKRREFSTKKIDQYARPMFAMPLDEIPLEIFKPSIRDHERIVLRWRLDIGK